MGLARRGLFGTLDGRTSSGDFLVEDRRPQFDFAYACFLFCGVSWLAAGVVSVMPLNEGTAILLGLGVLLPLFLLSGVAMIFGIVLSVLLRSWPLVVLAAMSVLAVAEF